MTEYVKSLYPKYSEDLLRLRTRLRDYHNHGHFQPQLEDIACELTYLFIRDRQPANIVEISPYHGWSSLIICMAIQDGGFDCEYTAYDIIDNSEDSLPPELKKFRKFVKGDVRNTQFSKTIDYLFMDSEHTYEFCQWYFDTLFPLLDTNGMMSIHDIVTEEGEYWYVVSNEFHQQESKCVTQFCENNNINLWVAKHNYPNFKDIRLNNIDDIGTIHYDNDVTSIAFIRKTEE